MKNKIDFSKNKKVLNIINNQANIWICVFACHLSNFNPFIICAAFIGYDLFAIIFNRVYLSIIPLLINDIDDLKKLKGSLADSARNAYYNNNHFSENYYNYGKKLISKKINKLELIEQKEKEAKLLEEKLKEEASGESRLEKTLNKQKELFNEGVTLLRDFKYDECLVPDNVYEEILNNVSTLEKVLDKNENGFIYVDATFTLLSKELIKLLKSFSAMEENISKENENKLNILLDEFNQYILRTIERVSNQNQLNIDASYEVVLNNIKKTN